MPWAGGEIMMDTKFDDFTTAVIEGVKNLANDIFAGFADQAYEDSKAFLKKAETDLKRWTIQLCEKQISEQDFKDFVDAKKSVFEMHQLTQKGIALIKLENFRSGFIDLVVNKAFEIFI